MNKKIYIWGLIMMNHIKERQKIKINQYYALKRRKLKIVGILKGLIKQE